MLNKDLIRYRRQKKRLLPLFVADDDTTLLTLGNEFLSLFRQDNHLTRQEIETQAMVFVNAFGDIKLAKGLYKTCLDRAKFSQAQDLDFISARQDLFSSSAKELQNAGGFVSYLDYRQKVLEGNKLREKFVVNGVYGDLPEKDLLENFRSLSSSQLLQRYNVSLVQSLLLQTGEMTIVLSEPDASQLRRIFKYLKFFRLLSTIRKRKKDTFELKIDGPISLFSQTQKYGLQLASFFPAVISCSKWKLEANVKIRQDYFQIKLDQKINLVSHYRHFAAYVPEEILLFHRMFKEKVESWKIVGETPLIQMGSEFIFPDLSFQSKRKDLIHLELFHRWHSGQLLKRLEQWADCKKNLLIGVDRSLLKDVMVKDVLESHELFETKGFLFRDFPGVTTVQRLLDKQ